MKIVDITIPLRTPTHNELLRMHFRARARLQNEMAWLVKEQVGLIEAPMARCRITIYRQSPGSPDHYAIEAGVKPLVDILCMPSRRHPCGLGIIVDDSPKHVSSLTVFPVKGAERTTRIVIVEEVAQ